MGKSSGISKISITRAQEEADTIVSALSGHGSPRETVDHLMTTYTPASAAQALSAAVKMLAKESARVDLEAAKELLSELAKRVNTRSGTPLTRAIIQLARAASPESGVDIAAEAVVGLLREPNDKNRGESVAVFSMFASECATASPSAAAEILAGILKQANLRNVGGRDFTLAWSTAARALIAERGGSISTTAASLMLTELSRLDPAWVSHDLLIVCPYLMARAQPDVVRGFETSPWGGLASKLVRSLRSSEDDQSSAARKDVRPSGGSTDSAAVTLPQGASTYETIKALARRLDELGRDVRDTETALARDLAKARLAKSEAIAEERVTREENTSLHHRVRDLAEKEASLSAEVDALREELAKWRSEVTHQQHESDTRLTLHDEHVRAELQARLSRPAENVRDHIISLLESSQVSAKIRVLGAAFDTLHSRLLSALGEESTKRIPSKLLAAREDKQT